MTKCPTCSEYLTVIPASNLVRAGDPDFKKTLPVVVCSTCDRWRRMTV